MKTMFLALTTVLFAFCLLAAPYALAETEQQNKMKACNEKAGEMKGDERKAFMKTCLGAKSGAKTVKKGPPQQEKMKRCNKEAGSKSLTGDERKTFMKDCLSAN
ncbi:MAG: PsiF family protein [Nitrospiraceae bacterium]